MKKFISSIKYIALTIIVCGECVITNGQTLSKKQNEILNMAQLACDGLRFAQAINLYEHFQIAQLPKEDMKKLADCYWQTRDYDKSLQVYLSYQAVWGNDFTDQETFRVGEVFARKGDYEQAAKWLHNLEKFRSRAQAYSPDSLSVLKGDSLVWKVGYLNLNTGYREFAPSLYQQTLVFSSNRPLNTKEKAFGWDGEHFSRLWQIPVSQLSEVALVADKTTSESKSRNTHFYQNLSKVFEGADVKAKPSTKATYLSNLYTKSSDSLPGTLVVGFSHLKYNVGGIAFSGDSVIYFSSNYAKANKQKDNRLLLMQGRFNGTSVENIKSLPFGENTYSVMHPAISPNGLVMVFSSDKKGGEGLFDLYYSTRENLNNQWKSPLLIPGKINSRGNEVFPSISPDGYLYFSSDGKQGLGGLDIYRIKLDNALAGNGIEEHLPSPVNSSSDDFGWAQTLDGKTAYFTSDRETNEDNIYSARYDEEAAAVARLTKQPRTLEGYVLDRQTMTPFAGATVFLWNKCNNKVYVTRTDDKGKYTYPLNKSCEVIILGTYKGYSKDCLTMNALFDPKSPNLVQKASHDLLLDRYTQNMTWRLNNIHYDFDKWNIRADARPILDSIVEILKTYPIKIELGSHTDSRGTFEYNDRLSQRRAKSAVAYIVSKGIDPSRIMAKGYGEHQLLNKCADGVHCSETEHQANRRTEVKVILSNSSGLPVEGDPTEYKTGEVIDRNSLPPGFF